MRMNVIKREFRDMGILRSYSFSKRFEQDAMGF